MKHIKLVGIYNSKTDLLRNKTSEEDKEKLKIFEYVYERVFADDKYIKQIVIYTLDQDAHFNVSYKNGYTLDQQIQDMEAQPNQQLKLGPLNIVTGEVGEQSQSRKGQRKLLIVDDDNDILSMYQGGLEEMGEFDEVIATDSPLSALAIIEAEEIKMVITDINMPDIDGLYLAEITSRQPKPPIIYLISADDPERHLHRAKKAHVKRYFEKPLPITELIEAIKTDLASTEG